MKDTGNAGFFPKKREREDENKDDNAYDSVIPEVREDLADYIDQMNSKFSTVQPFYNSLYEEIGELSQQWDALKSKVIVAKDRERQRQNEQELEGIVTLADPFNHLYIEQLALIREFATLCDDIDKFMVAIDGWIDFGNKRLASIKGYLKNSCPQYVLDMTDDLITMEQMKLTMARQVSFIKGEMSSLKDVYNKGDSDFQKDIREKLSERPELLAWAMPFFNPDENANVLQSALNTLKLFTKP